jgi:integrase
MTGRRPRRHRAFDHRDEVKDGHRVEDVAAARAAVDALRELKANSRKDQPFLFPAEAGSKRARHLHPESLSRAFARACDRLGIADASTHDLRRTCLSRLTIRERIYAPPDHQALRSGVPIHELTVIDR